MQVTNLLHGSLDRRGEIEMEAKPKRDFPALLIVLGVVLVLVNLPLALAAIPPSTEPGARSLGHIVGSFAFSVLILPAIGIGAACATQSTRTRRHAFRAALVALILGTFVTCTSAVTSINERLQAAESEQ